MLIYIFNLSHRDAILSFLFHHALLGTVNENTTLRTSTGPKTTFLKVVPYFQSVIIRIKGSRKNKLPFSRAAIFVEIKASCLAG